MIPRPESVLLHGPWIAGMMSLARMVHGDEGMNHVEWPLIESLRTDFIGVYGYTVVLLLLWAVCTLLVWRGLDPRRRVGHSRLFQGMAVLGMVCMGFAFGQNDLANCASPGLSGAEPLAERPGTGEEAVEIASRIEIGHWQLFVCGLLIVLGCPRGTRNGDRAAVNTGSHSTAWLYAPDWCQAVAGIALVPAERSRSRPNRDLPNGARSSITTPSVPRSSWSPPA